MAEHVTLLRPETAPSGDRGLSSGLPADLLEQVRGRLRILALFLAVGFSLDAVFFFANMGMAAFLGIPLQAEVAERFPFQVANLGGTVASLGIWLLARNRRVSPTRLLAVGLVYEVFICFVIAFGTIWEVHVVTGVLPLMTWVPTVVVLYPLILPGPPRYMVLAAIAAAAMVPLSLVLLKVLGLVPVTVDDLMDSLIQGVFAVGLAYTGARVIYGLGREVARARELGSYRLEEKLGQGGMGEVWRARHRMLARPAAIKLIRRSGTEGQAAMVTDEARRRFEREAQVIASLRSPHTVGLFDFGVASDGTFYYAMELLEGMDTDRLVRQFGPLVPERAIHVLRQVCHSLAEAELLGLVHRDIKPANIFLCRYGAEYDFVKVLDFGLVKTLEGGATTGHDGQAPTQENVIQGTPAFMAPEQALGGRPLDIRADIYATGCVGYWLLTGQVPFTADTAMGLLIHHAKTAPAAPSSRSELPIPESLDRLVLACLAKEPAERPQSARELAARLTAIADLAPWTEERAREWWERHRPVGH